MSAESPSNAPSTLNMPKENDIENPEELTKEVSNMFNEKRLEDLKKTFLLYKSFPKATELISKCFRLYINKRFDDIIKNQDIVEDPIKLIPQLINLKKELDNLTEECFGNEMIFKDANRATLCQCMSDPIYANQLSDYIDFCMKKGFEGKSQEEIDNTLNDIVSLFMGLNSKLHFSFRLKYRMTQRLIRNKTLSINTEKIFIDKLKQEAGKKFVDSLIDMINDFEANKKDTDAYSLSPSKGAPNGINFNVQVLQVGLWGIKYDYCVENFQMPKYMETCLEDFENYYLGIHKERMLRWILPESRLVIQYLYLKEKNTSVSTLPQYLTLLLLEKHGSLTIEKIAELLGCKISTVLYDINGLAFNFSFNPDGRPDNGVIIGSFKDKNFTKNDTIEINANFKVELQQFKTLPIPVEIEKNKGEKEEKEIKRFQNNYLQAKIVRILKSRIGQLTTHDYLINEVTKTTDLFEPQPQQIKENIELLIEKNAIKREKDKCYTYVPEINLI